MEHRTINSEVLYPKAKFVSLKSADLVFLKARAAKNPRKRVRLCAHQSVQDKVHEMFIVHGKGSYVRPHRHPNKTESFFLIEGQAEAIFFNDKGKIMRRIDMGAAGSGKQFYYRLSQPVYHTLLVKTKAIVFLEVTSGPFSVEDTQFPLWAPDGKDGLLVRQYMRGLVKIPRKR